MNRTALAAVLALGGLLAMSSGASAAITVTFIDYSTQGTGNDADVYAAGYAGVVPNGASFDTNPLVTPPPGNQNSVYQSPFNNTPLLETRSYFSVGAVGTNPAEGATSPTILTFSSDQSVFKMLWGSIDSYNTVSFYDSNNVLIDDFTGTEIVNLGMLGGSPVNFEQVALLSFDASSMPFRSIKFESSQAALEFALPVPIPAALPMLMAAFAGLGFAGWRSNRRPA